MAQFQAFRGIGFRSLYVEVEHISLLQSFICHSISLALKTFSKSNMVLRVFYERIDGKDWLSLYVDTIKRAHKASSKRRPFCVEQFECAANCQCSWWTTSSTAMWPKYSINFSISCRHSGTASEPTRHLDRRSRRRGLINCHFHADFCLIAFLNGSPVFHSYAQLFASQISVWCYFAHCRRRGCLYYTLRLVSNFRAIALCVHGGLNETQWLERVG